MCENIMFCHKTHSLRIFLFNIPPHLLISVMYHSFFEGEIDIIHLTFHLSTTFHLSKGIIY